MIMEIINEFIRMNSLHSYIIFSYDPKIGLDVVSFQVAAA